MTRTQTFSVRPPLGQPAGLGAVQGAIRTEYGRLYVSGQISQQLLGLPGAAWNDRRKAVELSLTLETLRAIRKRLGIQKLDMARMCSAPVLSWARAAGKSEELVNEMHKKLGEGWRLDLPWQDATGAHRPPFDHQRIMATAACVLDGVGLLGEMGTGKTRAAIEALRYKFSLNLIDVALVACPRGALNTWQREVKMWAPGLNVIRLSGSVVERCETVRKVAAAGTRDVVFLTNFDVIFKMKDVFLSLAGQRKLGLVADEMHKLTNPEAQVTKAFMALAQHSEWRVGMTGTPVSNKVDGVWSEWYILDLGLTFGANVVQFRREFFDVNQWTCEVSPKNDNVLDEIGLRMRRRGMRFTKAECLDLPPKVYTTQMVDMQPAQRKAYHEMEETLVAQLSANEFATAATQLVAILRLTQITSGFVPNSEGKGALHRFTPNPKLDALEELVRENIGQQQIIVWARYREDIRAIMERLKDLSPVMVAGGQSDDSRLDAETTFQNKTSRLLVGNPQAGGVALNLQQASLAIYYSQDHSLTARLQSEDRCHRSGSEIHPKITYIDMLCSGTADEVVRQAVLEKKEIAAVVVDLKRMLGLDV